MAPALLWAVCAALIVTRSFDQVLYFRVNVIMTDYQWYFASVVYPISYLCAIIPVVAAQALRGRLTPATRAFPVRSMAIMAVLDTASNLMSSWPQVALGGTAANVLSTLALPANMALAGLALGTRFKWTHYVGAGLAVAAGVAQVLPALVSGDAGGGATATGFTYAAWAAVMALSAVPTAAANVYKEGVLKADRNLGVDVWYVNAGESVFQLALAAVTAPLVAVPFIPGSIPFSDLPAYLRRAHACAVGTGGVCSGDVMPPAAWMTVYIGFNLAFSALMLVLFRAGSSTLFAVASTARVPVVAAMLLLPLLAGPSASAPGWGDAVAATLAVGGLALYQWQPELPPVGRGVALVSDRASADAPPSGLPSGAAVHACVATAGDGAEAAADVTTRLLEPPDRPATPPRL